MASDKRPNDQFYFDSADDEVVYNEGDSTTVDDSYLASLSERLGHEEGGASPSAGDTRGNGQSSGVPTTPPGPLDPALERAGARLFGPGTSNPLAISSFDVPRVDDPMSPGQMEDEGNDVIELEDDALEEIEDSEPAAPRPSQAAPSPAASSYPPPDGGDQGLEAVLSGPLRPGPSDLLQSVPPPPDEPDLLDPELNPATYDAPTFVRPSLIEQDPVPIIEIISGNEKGRKYRFEKDTLSMGRGLDNDVVLTDIAVSRRHLRLTRQKNSVTLEDLGSGNGTTINSAKAQTAPLSAADRVEAGNTVFRVVFPGEDSFPQQPVEEERPPQQPSGPLHQKSTVYLTDNQEMLAQIGVVPGVGVAGQQVSSFPQDGTPSSSYSSPAQAARGQRPKSSPWSFKLAMAGLVVLVILVGMVGLFAALYLRANLDQVQGQSQVVEPETPETYFNRGKLAYADRRWIKAAEAFEQVLALSPDNTKAQEYLAQSHAEQRNQGTLEAARQAIVDDNYEGAITSLKTIPRSSVYYPDALDLRSRAKQNRSDSLVVEARGMIAVGNKTLAREKINEALSLNPGNSTARELLREMDGGEVATKVPETPPPATPSTTPPVQPAGVAVGHKVNRPIKRTGPVKRPTPAVRPTPAPAPPAASGGFNQVLSQYKAGRFEAAAASARELSATTGSARDRSKARGMATKIERFAQAWRGAKSSGNSRQGLSYLENALRLDRQISGGHYASQIRPKLLKVYESNASRAWRAGQYASACQSAMRAQKIDRSSSVSGSMSKRCEAKAREYYEDGERARRSDLNKAKGYWRKVLNMVPRNNHWYSKAYSALNNAGRRRYLDEDE